MGTIISLDEKLKISQGKKDASIKKKKLLAVRNNYRCTHCLSKCEKCGVQIIAENRPVLPSYRLPYVFCDSCAEDYIDYIERLKGKKNQVMYWQNDAWMKVWATWIEHRGAMDNYLKSKEFERLLAEMRPNQP